MVDPQVTITLGRFGQKVVKETTGVSDGDILSAWVRLGSKRSLAESFGTGTDDSYCFNDKRTRGDTSGGSDIYNINLDDNILDPKDLRLKLTCKRISRRIEFEIEERKKAELHEKMDRAIRVLESPERSLLKKIPSSSGAAEPSKMDSISSSYTSQATNGARSKSPERVAKHSSGFSISRTAADQLSHVPSISHMDASRTTQFLINDPLEYSAEESFLANIPLSRGADEPPHMNPVSSYTSWATSGERPQSSDRVAKYFNGFSTPRTVVDHLLHVPSIRPMDASRTSQYLMSDPMEYSAEGSFLANIPLSRAAAEPPQMDPVSSYTSLATTGERPQSSNRVARHFNGFSTPVVDQLPHVPSIRPTDPLRTAQFSISDPLELPKFPLPAMSTAHVDSSKLVKEFPPVTGSMFETPFTDFLPPTVSSLLHSLGLGKYAINFEAEEIDMVALKQMGELDLKELGIPMGPRKKILSALHSMRPRVSLSSTWSNCPRISTSLDHMDSSYFNRI